MNSEKVKEIKESIQQVIRLAEYVDSSYVDRVRLDLLKDTLHLINELESENETFRNERIKKIEQEIASLHYRMESDKFFEKEILPNLGTFRYLYCAEDLKKAQDRIAELEEALLDMVVQFCQMGKEGYLDHTFMSAEENAFDVLDIKYGEKVDDVYKRFKLRWGEE